MNKTSMNLQDLFLNQARKENIPVTIYLTSGVQLKGIVRGFDAFTLVLETPGKPAQLVYKHAMASVVPLRPVGGVLVRDERTSEAPAAPSQENRPEE
jgi:host factor-I protein